MRLTNKTERTPIGVPGVVGCIDPGVSLEVSVEVYEAALQSLPFAARIEAGHIEVTDGGEVVAAPSAPEPEPLPEVPAPTGDNAPAPLSLKRK